MVKNVLNTLRKKQKNNKGFSLVELIVVIAIMAVLVGVLAPQFIKYVEKSRQSTDMQSVQQLKSSVETDISDNEKVTEVTIAISDQTATVTIKEGTTAVPASAPKASLKSSGWETVTYELDVSTGKWSTKSTKTYNKNDPGKDMNEVFSLPTTKPTTKPSTKPGTNN